MSADAPPPQVERDYPLARLTTVRTGGSGEFFARASSTEVLQQLLAWAAGSGLEVGIVGSGSNLLIADEGVRGLVVKLDGELAAIQVQGTTILCGGGARLPAVAARAARAGLSGIEFGVNIPGTVGGAVKMNANAYEGELGRVLEWVEVVTAAGVQRRGPGELGLAYRRSALGPGEIVARASLALLAAERELVQATLEEMRRRRHEAQPQGIKTLVRRSRTRTTPARRGPRRGSCWRGRAATGWLSAARASPPSTRTSSRTPVRRRRPTCSR